MATYLQKATCETHTVQADDDIDLGAEFTRVWIYAVAGGGIECSPGIPATEAGDGVKLFGSAGSAFPTTWMEVNPDFPSRYVKFLVGGDVTIHRSDAIGRRTGRR